MYGIVGRHHRKRHTAIKTPLLAKGDPMEASLEEAFPQRGLVTLLIVANMFSCATFIVILEGSHEATDMRI